MEQKKNIFTFLILLVFSFQIWQYIVPVIICIGLFGNTVTLSIAGDRTKKYDFMIRLLAVVDNMNLAVAIVDVISYMKYGPGAMIYAFNNWGCKLGLYIIIVLQHMEAWVIIMLTFERYVSIIYPLHVMRYLNLNRLKIIMSVILVLICMDYIPYLVTQNITDDPFVYPCQPTRYWGRKWGKFYNTWELIIFVFGPFGILLVANIVIIWQLAKRNRKQTNLGVNAHNNNDKDVKLRKQAPLLLSISDIFLITHGPMYFYLRTDFGQQFFSEDPVEQQYMDLGFNLCLMFLYVNYSVNFFIYVVTNEMMRKRFAGLLMRR